MIKNNHGHLRESSNGYFIIISFPIDNSFVLKYMQLPVDINQPADRTYS